MNGRFCFVVSSLFATLLAASASAEVIACFRGDFKEETPAAGWQYLWNKAPMGQAAEYQPFRWNADRKLYCAEPASFPSQTLAGYASISKVGGHPGNGPKGSFDCYTIAQYTASADYNGVAWITDGAIVRPSGSNPEQSVELRVYVNDAMKSFQVIPCRREPTTFVAELGSLRRGDSVYVAVGPNRDSRDDAFQLDYCISILPPDEKPAAPSITFGAPPDQPVMKGVAGRPDATFIRMHKSFIARGRQGGIDVLFLGDSVTAAWGSKGKNVWENRLAALKPANFGLAADTTQNVLWRIANGELDDARPRVVVLQIGTNNVGGYTAPEVAQGIAAITKQIRQKLPESKVLLLGIFPRGEKATDPLREKIKQVNSIIASLDDGVNVRYLDIGAAFLQPDGSASKEILWDYLHLSEKGYQIWADAMGPTLFEMAGVAPESRHQ